jgi:hypothetical protein
MNGGSIDSILISALCGTQTRYLGVYALDQIPVTLTRYPCAYVANTDPISRPGQHWTAFYHVSPTQLEFFDSYGSPPHDYEFPIPPDLTSLRYNSYPLQTLTSSVCGQYCIFYLYQRAHGVSLLDVVSSLRRTSNPDLFVRMFVSKLRSQIPESLNHSCFTIQICTCKQ